MATTIKLLIEFGNAAAPEVFAYNCSINTTRSFTMTATTSDFVDPNCTDPYAILWQSRSVDVLSGTIEGAGTMDPLSYGVLREYFMSGALVNCRVKIDEPLASGGGHYEGPFYCTSLALTKETNRGIVATTVTFLSGGTVEWVDASAVA